MSSGFGVWSSVPGNVWHRRTVCLLSRAVGRAPRFYVRSRARVCVFCGISMLLRSALWPVHANYVQNTHNA